MSSGRLLEVEDNRKFKMSAQKVAAYEGWSLTRGGHPTRGSSYTETILIFWKSGHSLTDGRWLHREIQLYFLTRQWYQNDSIYCTGHLFHLRSSRVGSF